MHKPTAPTSLIELQSFDSALSEALLPKSGYDVGRWLYVPCRYDDYRYILGTRGKKPLICCGINPSTAAPDSLDNTLKSVERIALNNGFDSFMMFNLYAQRATVPDDMDRELNPRLHRENMLAFRYMLENSGSQPVVWAAWGAIVEKRSYLYDCIAEAAHIAGQHGARFVSAGSISKRGHPHHPLYLKKDTPLDPFDIGAYLACLKALGENGKTERRRARSC